MEYMDERNRQGMNDLLIVLTFSEFNLIKDGKLKAFVRPFEEQLPSYLELYCEEAGPDGFFFFNPHTLDQDHATIASHHQVGDVLAVARRWKGIPGRGELSWESIETMPIRLARHHLKITDVRPVQVTKLTLKDAVQLGFPVNAFREEGLSMIREMRRRLLDSWQLNYPNLHFGKEPWAWLYQCEEVTGAK